MSMADKIIKLFTVACWTTPLAYGASIFIRAYIAERREGRNPALRLRRLTHVPVQGIM